MLLLSVYILIVLNIIYAKFSHKVYFMLMTCSMSEILLSTVFKITDFKRFCPATLRGSDVSVILSFLSEDFSWCMLAIYGPFE